mmetsp:Transcript_27382/g.26173  ORF Transcript_27382/g.26173 Transcript_27382/m.26173 type:complete len:226 (-) Transcript_27382:1490-2167(-)
MFNLAPLKLSDDSFSSFSSSFKRFSRLVNLSIILSVPNFIFTLSLALFILPSSRSTPFLNILSAIFLRLLITSSKTVSSFSTGLTPSPFTASLSISDGTGLSPPSEGPPGLRRGPGFPSSSVSDKSSNLVAITPLLSGPSPLSSFPCVLFVLFRPHFTSSLDSITLSIWIFILYLIFPTLSDSFNTTPRAESIAFILICCLSNKSFFIASMRRCILLNNGKNDSK